MYCRKCGSPNDDNAYRCTQCNDYLHGAPAQAPPAGAAPTPPSPPPLQMPGAPPPPYQAGPYGYGPGYYPPPYGPPMYHVHQGLRPDSHLVWAILATVLCCVPFGIPAIVYAAQVDSKYDRGDYAGAVAASNAAKMWSWIAFGLGLAGTLIYVFVLAAGSGL